MANDLCISALSADVQPNCNNPMMAGLEQIGYILNKTDIDVISREDARNNVINNITLKAGKRAFYLFVNTKNPFAGTNTAMQEGDVSNTYTNTLSYVVRDDGPDVTNKIINPLSNGEFVAIVESRWENDNKDNKYVIFGLQRGLKATQIEKQDTDDATAAAWAITLTETGASKPREYVFATDYETTKAMLEGLVNGQ